MLEFLSSAIRTLKSIAEPLAIGAVIGAPVAFIILIILVPFLIVFYLTGFIIGSLYLVGGAYVISAAVSFRIGRAKLLEIEQATKNPASIVTVRNGETFVRYLDGDLSDSLLWRTCVFIITTVTFYITVLFWFSYDPNIFIGSDKGFGGATLFVIDLMFRGAFLDFMEHFNLRIGKLTINHANHAFAIFSFTYRVYIPLFVIATGVHYYRLQQDLRTATTLGLQARASTDKGHSK